MQRTGRRTRLRAPIAAVAVATAIAGYAAPGAAAAPATIVGNTVLLSNTFDQAAYQHDAGTLAQLVVTGGSHNVTATQNGANGNPLFSSATIGPGSTGVNGTQFLPAGSYPFICTLHPTQMAATLNVTGSPPARPGVEVAIRTKRLAQAVKSSVVKVEVTITGSADQPADVVVRLGKRTIGEGQAGSSRVLKIPLSSKGHRRLERLDKAKLRVEATIPFGEPDTAKRTLK